MRKFFARFGLFSCVTLQTLWLVGCETKQDLGGPAADETPDDDKTGDGSANTPPAGLRAFVTSANYKGDLVTAAGGGMDAHAAADLLCANAAKGAGLSGTWVAYLSTNSDSANDHVVDDGPFYAVDGTTKLFDSKLGVGGGASKEIPDEKGGKPIDVTSGVDQWGEVWAQSSIASFWTGSSAGGAIAATCNSWTSSNLFDDGTHATYLGASTTVLSCEQEHHLLCLEQKEKRAGRKTKQVFVTSDTFNGDFSFGDKSGLAGADSRCAQAAKAGGLEGTFVAWLSGEEDGKVVRAADRIADARYQLLDGNVAFESKAQLKAGPTSPITITELGVELEDYEPRAWTGTLASGTPSPDFRCGDWTTADSGEYGIVGDVSRGGEEWSGGASSDAESCNRTLHLYCFEK